MSNDYMRFNLVTKFVCTNCGHQLALSHDAPRGLGIEYAPDKEDGITGAAKVEQSIGVHPCQNCYTKATAPLRALREALKEDAHDHP
ncbi:MAG TPA: hypothetical protein VL528_10795 [Oxalicibacterium sp.]|jgi:hypothetical protein|nr:hypothetical protein [Oxalicibacterium sp.]